VKEGKQTKNKNYNENKIPNLLFEKIGILYISLCSLYKNKHSSQFSLWFAEL
jgi:hypothetical protein